MKYDMTMAAREVRVQLKCGIWRDKTAQDAMFISSYLANYSGLVSEISRGFLSVLRALDGKLRA